MVSVATNVLVRYLTVDDPVQARQAADLLAGADAGDVSHTVLLEMAWVLRTVHGLEPSAIRTAFRQMLGLPSVRVDQPALIALTLEREERGYDFADALHLAGAGTATPLYTFDKRFARVATGGGVASL